MNTRTSQKQVAKGLGLAAALLLTTTMVHPAHAQTTNIIVGTSGAGGVGGGGNAGLGGGGGLGPNGAAGGGTYGGAGGGATGATGGNSTATGTPQASPYSVSATASYGVVELGGSGGGGGTTVGGNGGNGTLTVVTPTKVDGFTTLTVNSLLVGGNGGGASNAANGGNGGAGTATINDGQILAVNNNGTVILGGQAGGNAGNNLGGTGGSGSLILGSDASGLSTLNLGNNAVVETASQTFSASTRNGTGVVELQGPNNIEVDGTSTATINAQVTDYTQSTPTVAGILTKTGAGTLVLGNSNNSYSGGTVISNGTVSISADGDLGAAPTLTNYNTDTVTISSGATNGTLLTTANVTSNRQIILGEADTAATRQPISIPNWFPAGTSTLGTTATNGTYTYYTNYAPVSVDTINTGVYTDVLNGTISGSGGLTKAGSGTLVLTPSFSISKNIYTGNTTINGGTIELIDGSTTGQDTGAQLGQNPSTTNANNYFNYITDPVTKTTYSLDNNRLIMVNGTLDINRSTAINNQNDPNGVTFSMGRNVELQGGANTIYAPHNANNPNSVVYVPYNAWPEPDAQYIANLSNTIDTDGNATNGYTQAVFTGSVTGNGALTKTGQGLLYLNSAGQLNDSNANYDAWTGGTNIMQGILLVNGNTTVGNNTNDYSIARNGIMHAGIVHAPQQNLTSIASWANASGGWMKGTNANGQQSTADYGVLAVNGRANLTGAVLALDAQDINTKVGTKYNVVVATKGIDGQFNYVRVDDVNGLGYSRYLIGTQNTNATVTSNGYTFAADQVTVSVLTKADGSWVNAPAFYSGRFYAANGYAQNASLFNAMSAPNGTGAGFWLRGMGSFGNTSGANFNYKGFVIGNGFTINQHLVIGGAISNAYTHTAGQNSSYVNGTNFGAELYGVYTIPQWTFTGTAMAGHIGNRSTRYLPYVGVGKAANNGNYEGVEFKAVYNWITDNNLFVNPYAMVNYLHTGTGRGQETGLMGPYDMNLRYGRSDNSLSQIGGGVTLGYVGQTSFGTVTPWASIGGLGTLGNTRSRVQETLGYESSSETAWVASSGAVTPSVGIQLAGKTNPWKLAATWNGQFASHGNANAFTLQGSYKW